MKIKVNVTSKKKRRKDESWGRVTKGFGRGVTMDWHGLERGLDGLEWVKVLIWIRWETTEFENMAWLC